MSISLFFVKTRSIKMSSYYESNNAALQPNEVSQEGQELNNLAQNYGEFYYDEPVRKTAKRRQGYGYGHEVDEYNNGYGYDVGIGLLLIGLLVAAGAILLLPSVLVTSRRLGTGNQCHTDSDCVSDICRRGICFEKLGTGNNCHEDSDCLSDYCFAGFCLDTCARNSNCQDGQCCLADSDCESVESVCRRNGTAKSVGYCERCESNKRQCKDGASCGMDLDCQSQLCDKNGVCVDNCARTQSCLNGQRCSETSDCQNINDACINVFIAEEFLEDFDYHSIEAGALGVVSRVPTGPICASCCDQGNAERYCRNGAICSSDEDCLSGNCVRVQSSNQGFCEDGVSRQDK